MINNLNNYLNSKNQQKANIKKIGHYSFSCQNQIGKGFSSVVYQGRNNLTEQIVAIKVIDMLKLNDNHHKKMLENEIQILKELNNAHILQLLDVYQSSNHTYIVTEYCDQGDLGTQIKKSHKFSEQKALKVISHILKGYYILYQKGIIHRDLKPANILINDGVAKIADFGFARPSEQKYNQTNLNVGTPYYMPPETYKYNQYSFKSDIFAIGVIFYEMLFGKPPWNPINEKDLFEQICSNKITFPNQISNEAKDFIQQCLKPQPELRISFDSIQIHPLIKNYIMKRADTQRNHNYTNYNPQLEKENICRANLTDRLNIKNNLEINTWKEYKAKKIEIKQFGEENNKQYKTQEERIKLNRSRSALILDY